MIQLIPLTPAFLAAVLADRRDEAAALLSIALPDEFPVEERRFFAMRHRQMLADERFREWCPFAVVLDGRMIGHAGYHGPPGVNSANDPDAVEFGYTIYPPWRGNGYATQAARLLMQRAAGRRLVVSCAPGNDASLAIIGNLGFVKVGEQIDEEDGLEWVFVRDAAPPTGAGRHLMSDF